MVRALVKGWGYKGQPDLVPASKDNRQVSEQTVTINNSEREMRQLHLGTAAGKRQDKLNSRRDLQVDVMGFAYISRGYAV